MTESLAVFAGLFVKFQAVFDDFQYLPFTVDSRQLFCQLGMPTEFAAQLHPKPLGPFDKGAGWANLHALATVQAFCIIDLGTLFFCV